MGPSESYDVKAEFGVKQVMRDGTRLSSDIYRPDSHGRFPVIVTRTPYTTLEGFMKLFSDEGKFFAKHGYVFVIQDCRGKNDSEGWFHPFHDDAEDGYDTLAWCARQEWSNGSLGTFGASYQAWNQWATAALSPPWLRAMVCVVALPDPVLNVPFQNGALVLWMAQWMAMVEGKRNTTPSIYEADKLYWHLPLRTMDNAFGWSSKFWREWVEHPSADQYWKKTFYQDKFDRIGVPVLHVSGWYDDDIIGTHLNYLGMVNGARTKSARKNQKLVIGPWQHLVNSARKIGEIDFGDSALIDLQGLELRWFDRWLKGAINGVDREPPVDIFVLGRNAWRKEKAWPPSDVTPRVYYLYSKGRANTAFGDGRLVQVLPRGEIPSDSYAYDPANPCTNIYDSSHVAAEGPYDQRPIERREDVLVYSTEELGREVEVTGPIKVNLFASTSATDTDFWAQLVDVFPNGYSMHLTEGVIRGRYRKTLERAELLRPGQVYEFDIDLWVTSNLFLKGHRIRLDVSSSSFPKYDRNPNTGDAFGQNARLKVAEQKIFHDEEHPSSIALPTMSR